MSAKKNKNGDQDHLETVDGVDIKRLFNSIWGVRKFVVYAVLFAALVFASAILTMRVAIPIEQVFQHRVTFIFDGVNKQKYPNGTDFSRGDLIAPAVLKKVFDDNDLSEHDYRFEEFATAISIYPFSSKFDNIVSRYNVRLANRRLTFAQRVEIEKGMQKEIAAQNYQSAQIRFVANKRLGLSETLGGKIVRDIPAAWAKISIEQRGVLNLATGFETNRLVEEDLFGSLDYLLAIDLLRTSAARLKRRIEKIEIIDGAGTVVDDASDHTLMSLRRSVQDLSTYKLQEMMFLSTEFALAKTPQKTLIHFKNKLKNLLKEQETLQKNADSVKTIMDDYSSEKELIVSNTPAEEEQISTDSSTTVTHYGDAFLNKIVSLTARNADQRFRQTLATKRLAYMGRGIGLNAEIELAREIVSKFSNIDLKNSGQLSDMIAENKKYVTESLPEIRANINQMWNITTQLQNQLSFKRLSFGGRIYNDDILTSSESITINHPIFNQRVGMFYIAGLFLVAILAVIMGLIWQAIRRGRGAEVA